MTIKTSMIGLCLLTLAAMADGRPGDLYRSPGKLGAPVALEVKAVFQVNVGETVSVPLVLEVGPPGGSLRVEIQASEGLYLEQPRSVRRTVARAPGRIELAPINALALQEGRHYIGVTVFMGSPGTERFRTFAIPVEAGDAARRPAAKRRQLGVDPDGRPVHILPARETN